MDKTDERRERRKKKDGDVIFWPAEAAALCGDAMTVTIGLNE